MIVISLAAVIILWIVALQIWNITTLTRSLATVRGIARLIGGTLAGFAALALLYFALPPGFDEVFSYLSIVTFLAALAVEFIIGDDMRRFIERKR